MTTSHTMNVNNVLNELYRIERISYLNFPFYIFFTRYLCFRNLEFFMCVYYKFSRCGGVFYYSLLFQECCSILFCTCFGIWISKSTYLKAPLVLCEFSKETTWGGHFHVTLRRERKCQKTKS